MREELKDVIQCELGLTVQENVPLAEFSSIRSGGPAQYLVTVGDGCKLRRLAQAAFRHEAPFFVLGGGSNTLFADAGMTGLTILNRCRAIAFRSEGGGTILEAESGSPLARCARLSMQEELTGLEWAVSVPGTLGGAAVGNAGAHGSDMAACLHAVNLCRPDCSDVWMPASRLHMRYRHSDLKNRGIGRAALNPMIIRLQVMLQSGQPAEIQRLGDEFLSHRRTTQPTEPSLGSVFRNPPGRIAGELIEDAGCKGLACGSMRVSTKHANFIVRQSEDNRNSSQDAISLIRQVQRRVEDFSGVRLQTEIGLAGDWPSRTRLD